MTGGKSIAANDVARPQTEVIMVVWLRKVLSLLGLLQGKEVCCFNAKGGNFGCVFVSVIAMGVGVGASGARKGESLLLFDRVVTRGKGWGRLFHHCKLLLVIAIKVYCYFIARRKV